MTKTASALDNMMAQAEAAAATYQPPALTQAPENLPAPANNNSALAKPSLADFANSGGMTVDEFVQVKAEGFRIGKDMKGLLDELIVEIDMSEVIPIFSARGETGGNTKFIKSYDGQTTDRGENFNAALAHLQRTNTKFEGPYKSAEIPMELVDDVKDPKSALTFDSGTSIGLTPSITGFKSFQKFMKSLTKSDPSLLEATLKVKLVHEKKTNSNNNEWGVLNFELIEVL
jgi:hypothetical protein